MRKRETEEARDQRMRAEVAELRAGVLALLDRLDVVAARIDPTPRSAA